MLEKKKISYISEELEEFGGQAQKLKKKLKECQKEREEYLTQAQRARADLINFRRRQEKAIEEIGKYGQENIIRELLLVLDSLRIGARGNKGIKQIKEQLEAVLGKYGLKEIKALGEKFNPEFHEAVEQIKSKGKEEIVVEEIQKGYILNDRVLRPTKVKISK